MLYNLIWLFFCYAFLGWVMETVVATIRNKKFMNRGLLDGPLCAIYGIAGVLISVSLTELRGNWFFLFLFSAIYATVLEWLAGHFLERSRYGRWWDYSNVKWNLDGYICLPYSVLWGVLGTIVVQWGTPLLQFVYQKIPEPIGPILLWTFMILTAIDGIGSLILLYGRQGTIPGLENVDNKITVATQHLQDWITYLTRKRLEKINVKEKPQPVVKSTVFAEGASFYKIFLLFFVGAFLGDVTETIFCRITGGIWMSRSSVVWGPFSLVWGIALGLATLLLYKYKDRSDRFLFLMGTLLGGAYEYFCSVFTEVFFGTVFWDYSKIPFNLGGRINLLYCFFWGIAAVVWMKMVYPYFSKWIEKIPMRPGKIITWILVVFMTVNVIVSGLAMARYNQRSNQIPATESWQVYMDEHYDDKTMNRIYPNAQKVEK